MKLDDLNYIKTNNLESFKKIEIEDYDYDYIIYDIAYEDRINFLKYMMSNFKLNHQETLQSVIIAGNNKMLEFLITQNYKLTETELFRAVQYRCFDCIKTIIKNGIDPHSRFNYAYHLAVRNKLDDIVNYLKGFGI